MSQGKAQECFYLGPAPSHPRDAVRVLTKHRTLIITRHVTWQRVSPAPPVPAQMHDSLSQEEEGSKTDNESTSSRGGGGVMAEQDEGFDLHAFLRERSQETPAAGDASDWTVETMDSSQGGTMDASLVPAGRAETVETMELSQGGTMDASSILAGRAEIVETIYSIQGGAMDACSVPEGRAESDSSASAASGTNRGNGDDPPAVLSKREAHELSSWGQLPPTVMGRARGQSQRLQDESAQRQRVIEGAVPAAVPKWAEFWSILANTSWTMEDAMIMMAGGPDVEDNKGKLRVCMPSGFLENVEPLPQSAAGVELSKYKEGCREAMNN